MSLQCWSYSWLHSYNIFYDSILCCRRIIWWLVSIDLKSITKYVAVRLTLIACLLGVYDMGNGSCRSFLEQLQRSVDVDALDSAPALMAVVHIASCLKGEYKYCLCGVLWLMNLALLVKPWVSEHFNTLFLSAFSCSFCACWCYPSLGSSLLSSSATVYVWMYYHFILCEPLAFGNLQTGFRSSVLLLLLFGIVLQQIVVSGRSWSPCWRGCKIKFPLSMKHPCPRSTSEYRRHWKHMQNT